MLEELVAVDVVHQERWGKEAYCCTNAKLNSTFVDVTKEETGVRRCLMGSEGFCFGAGEDAAVILCIESEKD